MILNATLPKERHIQSKLETIHSSSVSVSSPVAFSTSIRPSSVPVPLNFTSSKFEPNSVARAERAKDSQPSDLLRRLYSRSDLLGGHLTLGDLNEPLMPPIARAERAQSTRTGDPLSTVPQMWREPMRKALRTLSENLNPLSGSAPSKSSIVITVEQARVIHIPSSRVKRFSEVPLALQSDGTVDILNSPDDPEVVEEIKTWSSKQQLPAKGEWLLQWFTFIPYHSKNRLLPQRRSHNQIQNFLKRFKQKLSQHRISLQWFKKLPCQTPYHQHLRHPHHHHRHHPSLSRTQANLHRLNRRQESQKFIPTHPLLRIRERFNEIS